MRYKVWGQRIAARVFARSMVDGGKFGRQGEGIQAHCTNKHDNSGGGPGKLDGVRGVPQDLTRGGQGASCILIRPCNNTEIIRNVLGKTVRWKYVRMKVFAVIEMYIVLMICVSNRACWTIGWHR